MSKNISSGFRSHLAGETLTLAACWEITREFDEKQFFFTDHDTPLPIDGNSYQTANGFTRSAVKVTNDLSAQGLSVAGVFDSKAIKDEDLIKGLFDNATIRFFLVNYADLTQGKLWMKYGRFGTVQRQSRSGFQVELTDIMQKLNQPHDDRRQPLCRARLGDKRCNNATVGLADRNPTPIVVPVRQDSTAYILGDVIKVVTGPDPLSYQVDSIVNPSFESGDLTGWTLVQGAAAAVQTDDGVPPPVDGSWMLGMSGAVTFVDQIVDLQGLPDFVPANVDSGDVSVQRFSVWQVEKAGGGDLGGVELWAVDGGGSDISNLLDTGYFSATPGSWHQITWSGPIPALTRQLRIRIKTPDNPSDTDVDHDHVQITMEDAAQPAGSSFAYEDRIYRCTVAGTTAASAPTYDTTIGNPTVDGTATFVAELSYMQAGEVLSSADNRNFTVRSDLWTDPLYDSPWFAYGGLVWEVGNNTGWVSEVRSAEPPDFTLKFKAPFPILPGDKFRVYPGCDLRLTTCNTKWVHNPATATQGNINNNRSEPHLAGIDAGSQYPDAQS